MDSVLDSDLGGSVCELMSDDLLGRCELGLDRVEILVNLHRLKFKANLFHVEGYLFRDLL